MLVIVDPADVVQVALVVADTVLSDVEVEIPAVLVGKPVHHVAQSKGGHLQPRGAGPGNKLIGRQSYVYMCS